MPSDTGRSPERGVAAPPHPSHCPQAAQFEQLLRDEAELDRLLAPLAAGREDVGLPQDGAWDESTAAFRALLASMGAMPMDPEGIHNYLFPGDYDLRLLGGDKALVFYTYATDTEVRAVWHACLLQAGRGESE